jgi:hypothetical protein
MNETGLSWGTDGNVSVLISLLIVVVFSPPNKPFDKIVCFLLMSPSFGLGLLLQYVSSNFPVQVGDRAKWSISGRDMRSSLSRSGSPS